MEFQTIDIVVIAVSFILIGISIFLYLQVKRLKSTMRSLTSGVDGNNLEFLLKTHLERITRAENKSEQLQKDLESFKNFSKKHFQKFGFKRYNPFHETGGDQSFILALLDQENNGFIITSMHQRQMTRVYGKDIKNGECKNKLSAEEKELLQQTKE